MGLETTMSQGELCDVLSVAGEFARFRGDRERSIGIEMRSIAIARELGMEERVASNLHDLAENLASASRVADAWEAGLEALEIRQRLGSPAGLAHALQGLSTIAAAERDWERALEFDQQALAIARETDLGAGYMHGLLSGVASDYRHAGDRASALAIAAEVLPTIDVRDEADALSYFLEIVTDLAAEGRPDIAARSLGAFDAVESWSGLGGDVFADRPALERRLRASLGDGGFDREYARSAACSPEEALEFAQAAVECLAPPDAPPSGWTLAGRSDEMFDPSPPE
jgi:tetratricopeptide (TPR) repeat protein